MAEAERRGKLEKFQMEEPTIRMRIEVVCRKMLEVMHQDQNVGT